MGESDRYIEYRDRSRRPLLQFNINSPAMFLVIINFTVFLFIKFLDFGRTTGDTSISPYFYEQLTAFLLPGDFIDFTSRPWSFITYGFFHFSFLNLVSNMLWLWAFGSILQTVAGNRKTVPLYLYGIAAGALGFLITASFMSPGSFEPSILSGANAGIMSIAVAATMLAPDYRFFQHLGKGIPLWILTAIYLLIDLVSLRTFNGPPVYIAHIMGAAMGATYVYYYNRGYDIGAWMQRFYRWITNAFTPKKPAAAKSVKEKVFYQAGNRDPYTRKANITQQRIDEILDKISQKGYNQLSEEEKNILKRAGEEGV